MANASLALVGSVMGLIVAGITCAIYLRLFRRIPSLEAFTPSQRRVLIYQLTAISFWTLAAFGIFLYAVWSGLYLTVLFVPPGKFLIAVLNWGALGFVAVTSIIPGVSILSSLRGWTGAEPAKGQSSMLMGIALLGLLVYWTWKVLLPGP